MGVAGAAVAHGMQGEHTLAVDELQRFLKQAGEEINPMQKEAALELIEMLGDSSRSPDPTRIAETSRKLIY